MADSKISALTAVTTPLSGTEVLPVVQNGTTKQVSVVNLTAGRSVSASQLVVDNASNGAGTIITGSTGSAVNQYQTFNHSPGGGAYAYTNLQITGQDIFAAGLLLSSYAGHAIVNAPHSTGSIDLKINGATKASVNSAGNIVITNSGNGIDFSATPQPAGMTSELLADYEEGTWTPALLFDGGMSGSFTYTTQEGTYTKIGRLVTARFNLAWSAIPSAGTVMVMALPFTAASAARVNGYISNQGGITNTGTYTITAGNGLVVSTYISTQCSISTVKSGGAYADPLQKSALTSASGMLAGEIIFEV